MKDASNHKSGCLGNIIVCVVVVCVLRACLSSGGEAKRCNINPDGKLVYVNGKVVGMCGIKIGDKRIRGGQKVFNGIDSVNVYRVDGLPSPFTMIQTIDDDGVIYIISLRCDIDKRWGVQKHNAYIQQVKNDLESYFGIRFRNCETNVHGYLYYSAQSVEELVLSGRCEDYYSLSYGKDPVRGVESLSFSIIKTGN